MEELKPETKKVTVNLPVDVLDELQQIAGKRNVTLTQALKDAISLDYYVRSRGETFYVPKDHGKSVQEVKIAR
jgi:hypothetical protein